jgi:hypothetical protein
MGLLKLQMPNCAGDLSRGHHYMQILRLYILEQKASSSVGKAHYLDETPILSEKKIYSCLYLNILMNSRPTSNYRHFTL